MGYHTMDNNAKKHNIFNQLYKDLSLLCTPAETEKLLADLCTPSEIEAMAGRWAVVLLLKKKLSYRAIQEKTGVSLATITRVARPLKHGAHGYDALYRHHQQASDNKT